MRGGIRPCVTCGTTLTRYTKKYCGKACVPHGTYYRYDEFGCRCEPCTSSRRKHFSCHACDGALPRPTLKYCSEACRYRNLALACSACGRVGLLVLGLCPAHYSRLRRNGNPLVKQRTGGLDDGSLVVGQSARIKKTASHAPGLSPAQVAILFELADGRARSLGLIADITGYSIATVLESVYRMRRAYGAETIEVQHSPKRFRLTSPIALPS